MRLNGRTAVITGGSGGIGNALAKALVSKGVRVFSIDRQRPEQPVMGVTYLLADITQPAQVKRALDKVGRVDVLINNAGIMRRGTLFDSSVEDFDALFGINVRGSWLVLKCARLAKRAMVVQITSRHATNPAADPGLYSLTKQTTMHLAELVKKTRPGYDVRIVFPGPVDTKLLRYGRSKESVRRIMRVALTPEEFAAKVVRFLRGDKKRLLFDERKWAYHIA
jgi:3-oxoacyl-[acyl-carrier protein] reductase